MKLALSPGSTSVITHVFCPDSTSTAGAGKTALAFEDITAYYVRAGGALTALTMVDQTTLGTWDADATDDKLAFKKLHDTNAPGLYELSLPNNILVAGTTSVVIQLRATNMAPTQLEIQLAAVPANLIQILAAAVTGTAAQLVAAFTKFFDVAAPTATCLSLPDAVPGAAGGLPTTNGTKISQTVDLTASQIVFKKNVARANFAFPMFDSTGALKTGLTVTAVIRKDAGAAFAALAGSVTEIGATGWYTVDWAQAETNADTIAFSASAAGANPTTFTILTQA